MTLSSMSSSASRHRELAEIRPSGMAKANLRNTEISPVAYRAAVGHAIQRAASVAGWSLKELAGRVDRDPRQVARWLDGSERPHFDALFAIEEFRQPLAVALAELAECEITTVITIRRRAR